MKNNCNRQDQELLDRAFKLREHAYAPYSNYQVAAVIEDDFGVIHDGVNVENAAYPAGTCAEAGAISAMISLSGNKVKIRRIFVVASNIDQICTPCGGCRQRIREFANDQTRIICSSGNGKKQREYNIKDLLPDSFGPNSFGT